jgi:pimeloyl-ACP methyl ester carboxylesterase
VIVGIWGLIVATLDSSDRPGSARPSVAQTALPLICIHGLAGSSAWWAPVSARLGIAGLVDPIDLPRALKPSDLSAWVVELLGRRHGGAGVDLAGHSLGALVALRVAADHPELVRRLILISPPGIVPRGSTITFAWPLVTSLTRTSPRFLGRLAADASRAGPVNILRGARHVAVANPRLDAHKVVAPTLLVWGAGDRLAPSASAGEWMDALPDARVHVIPTASHVPMIEAPDELVSVIRKFRDER